MNLRRIFGVGLTILTVPVWAPFRYIPPLGKLAHGLDQTLNGVLGGEVDETISSRLGKLKIRSGGTIPWRKGLGVPRLLDELLHTVDPFHSIDAIEPDEGENLSVPPGHPHHEDTIQ